MTAMLWNYPEVQALVIHHKTTEKGQYMKVNQREFISIYIYIYISGTLLVMSTVTDRVAKCYLP